MKKEKTKMINRISEFFKTLYGLFMFSTKSIWIILKNDMKKEAQTYKEEREEQKRIKNREK
jgi:hypothetical protein